MVILLTLLNSESGVTVVAFVKLQKPFHRTVKKGIKEVFAFKII